MKVLKAKFIFKAEKQIETQMDRSVALEISFFNGNGKSLLKEIHKLKIKIEQELKVMTQEESTFSETEIAKSVDLMGMIF